jgi:Fe2+ or Zn2+ uptake regulation protein
LLVPETETQRQIVRVLQDAPDGLTVREIAERLPSVKYDAVQKQLKRWHNEGKIDFANKRYRLYECQEVSED